MIWIMGADFKLVKKKKNHVECAAEEISWKIDIIINTNRRVACFQKKEVEKSRNLVNTT